MITNASLFQKYVVMNVSDSRCEVVQIAWCVSGMMQRDVKSDQDVMMWNRSLVDVLRSL